MGRSTLLGLSTLEPLALLRGEKLVFVVMDKLHVCMVAIHAAKAQIPTNL